MNAFEIIGLACVDNQFRDELFNQTATVTGRNPDLTWSEQQGLVRVTTALTKDELKLKMGEVGAILRGCPNPPCPWPSAFTSNAIPLA